MNWPRSSTPPGSAPRKPSRRQPTQRQPSKRMLSVTLAAAALAVLCVASQFTPSASAGFTASVLDSTNKAGTAQYFTCAANVTANASNALFVFKLNEASGSTSAVDASATSGSDTTTGTYTGLMTTSTTTPLACPRDTGGAYVLDGSTSYLADVSRTSSDNSFTEEVWFKTTTAAGKLMGFGNVAGTATTYDRHMYINSSSNVVFGVQPGGTIKTITSPLTYTDGKWHMAAASMSSAGIQLYLDGKLVASDATVTTGRSYSNNRGSWSIGYGTLTGWPLAPSSFYFKGSMRYAAVYNNTLTATQILDQYVAGS